MRESLCTVAFVLAGALAGAQAAEGRWEGVARLPGGPAPVVIDLAPQGDGWAGAVTLPGRGVSGTRLRTVERAADGGLRATLPDGTTFELRPGGDGCSLEGQLRQGGHSAALALTRSGAAQLGAPAPTAPLAPSLAGTWRGRYDIGFGPREVTLRIAPPARASMTIVGRRTVEVSFDEVRQFGALIMLRAHEADITIEAPWAEAAQGQLVAVWLQGPFESALRLQREAAR
jgi:hypothetical protein